MRPSTMHYADLAAAAGLEGATRTVGKALRSGLLNSGEQRYIEQILEKARHRKYARDEILGVILDSVERGDLEVAKDALSRLKLYNGFLET